MKQAAEKIIDEQLDYYHMNYQALFGASHSEAELQKISLSALENKSTHQETFTNRLNDYVVGFQEKGFSVSPFLKAWDMEQLNDLIQKHDGLLVALFHFGHHRHALLDLITMDVETVAPIAGQAYTDFHKMVSTSSPEFHSKIELLEVEKNDVGKKLLRALKKGKVGGIYVDGNMGPSSQNDQDSTTMVDFFNHQIKVKVGIARLAALLKLPILPVFCLSEAEAPRVEFGQPILPQQFIDIPSRENQYQSILQRLYIELEERVKTSPASWEYSLCFHRWVVSPDSLSVENSQSQALDLASFKFIQVNTAQVSLIKRDNCLYWVNTALAKGFKIPANLVSIFETLYQEKQMKLKNFVKYINQENGEATALLQQMMLNKLVCLKKNLT